MPKQTDTLASLKEAHTQAGLSKAKTGRQSLSTAALALAEGIDKPINKPEPIRDGLTAKQDNYAKLRANGLTKADAYRQSYDCGNSLDSTIHVNAVKLESNAKVTSRIAYYIDMQDRLNQHDPMKIRLLVLDTLISIAADRSQKASDRNRSAELLGKVRGVDLFKDADPSQTAANVQTMTDLSNRLRAFIDARTPQPIEGQAVLVSDTEANDHSEPSGIDNSPEPES